MTVLARQAAFPSLASAIGERKIPKPTPHQRRWLSRGLQQPGGKLPLFDGTGRRISERTVRSCIDNGWAEVWFANPVKPDWIVCRLTDAGHALATGAD